MNYLDGSRPDEAYETWKKNWTPPRSDIRVRRGMVLVEFGPYGNSGAIWTPEKTSFNAKVICDSTGELSQGAEVALEGDDSDGFMLDGRKVYLVPKSSILMEILE